MMYLEQPNNDQSSTVGVLNLLPVMILETEILKQLYNQVLQSEEYH